MACAELGHSTFKLFQVHTVATTYQGQSIAVKKSLLTLTHDLQSCTSGRKIWL